MGLNLKNEHLYGQRRNKTYVEKLKAIAKEYISLKNEKKLDLYHSDPSNFSQSVWGVPNPFLLELKNYSVREITIRSIVDTLSREALDILREEFTARVCKIEAESINVVRMDNNQDKLEMMYAEKLDILHASKSQLMTDEVFRFNNNRNFDADTTVAEYLNEYIFELVLEPGLADFKHGKFVDEMKLIMMEFMKAYGAGIKQKYEFKSKSSLKGVVSNLELRNEGNVLSNSKIVRWVYKDTTRENDA